MSYANHPLLVSSVPVTNPLTVSEGTWACSAITAPNTLDINPKSVNSSLQVGDLMMVVIVARLKNGTATKIKSPADWNCFGGRFGDWNASSSYEGKTGVNMFWKFYVSGDNKTHSWTISDTDTYCYNVVMFRGVSKKVPFPHVRGVLCGQTLNNDNETKVIWSQALQAGNDYGNMMMWTAWDVGYDGNGDFNNPPLSFDPASGPGYIGPSGVTLALGNYYANRTASGGGDGQMHHLGVFKGVPTNAHQNLIATMTPIRENLDGIIDYTSAYRVRLSASDGDADNSVFHVTRALGWAEDNSTDVHYLEWQFSATAGDQIVCLHRTFFPRSSTEGKMGTFVLVDPSNNVMSGVTANDQNTTTSIQSATVSFGTTVTEAPDAFWGMSEQTGSAFSDPHPQVTVLVDTAPSTGTYKLRCYTTAVGDTGTFNHTIGSGTYQGTGLMFDYVAVAVNGMPSEVTTSGSAQATGAGNSYSRTMHVPIAFARDLDDDWPNDNGWSPSSSEAYRRGNMIATIGDPDFNSGTFQAPMLYDVKGVWGVVAEDSADSGYLSIEGTGTPAIQPGHHGAATTTYGWGLKVVDRPIYPNYYATEDASSPTDGKYYWEVTLDDTPAVTGRVRIGFCSPFMMHSNDAMTDQGTGGGLMYYDEGELWALDGNASAEATTLTGVTGGDVLGFAVNYATGAVDVYVNGSLDASTTLNNIGDARQDFVAAVLYRAEDVRCGVTFNLTGPFTYTKPTGYVAYDWTNETA